MKAESKYVNADETNEARKRRWIWNVVPRNSSQEGPIGDVDLLLSPLGWNAMHLRALEVLLVTIKDRASFVNIFYLPARSMAAFCLVNPVRASSLFGSTRSGDVYLGPLTPCMRWKRAVGL